MNGNLLVLILTDAVTRSPVYRCSKAAEYTFFWSSFERILTVPLKVSSYNSTSEMLSTCLVEAQHTFFRYPDPKVLVPRPERFDIHSRITDEIVVQMVLVPIAFAQSTKEGLYIARF